MSSTKSVEHGDYKYTGGGTYVCYRLNDGDKRGFISIVKNHVKENGLPTIGQKISRKCYEFTIVSVNQDSILIKPNNYIDIDGCHSLFYEYEGIELKVDISSI